MTEDKNQIIVVGIDASRNSTGVCVRQGNKTKYYSLLNFDSLSKAKKVINQEVIFNNMPELEDLFLNQDWLSVDNTALGRQTTNISYSERQLSGVKTAIDIGESFEVLMMRIHQDFQSNHPPRAIMEGYSYGSATNNLVQIVEISTIMRTMIVKQGWELKVVAGPTVKSFAGSGKLDKYGMYKAFMEESNDELQEYLNLHGSDHLKSRTKKGKPFMEVKTPVNDLIDAWWLTQYGIFREDMSRKPGDVITS